MSACVSRLIVCSILKESSKDALTHVKDNAPTSSPQRSSSSSPLSICDSRVESRSSSSEITASLRCPISFFVGSLIRFLRILMMDAFGETPFEYGLDSSRTPFRIVKLILVDLKRVRLLHRLECGLNLPPSDAQSLPNDDIPQRSHLASNVLPSRICARYSQRVPRRSIACVQPRVLLPR